MNRSNLKRTLAAGLIAAGAIACGDASMKLAGEMMGDAGDVMMQMSAEMMDASGRAMKDAGGAVGDAGEGSAAAQDSDSCSSCTVDGPIEVTVDAPVQVTGVSRTISARDDPAQMKSRSEVSNNDFIEGPVGPFVLTTLIPASSTTEISAYLHDVGSCDAGGRVDAEHLAWAGTGGNTLQNVRFLVPTGKVLCFSRPPAENDFRYFTWSGYVPYE